MTTSHPREERGQAGESFVLVPREPTPKMVSSTWNDHVDVNGGIESQNARNKRIYRAMIAAAPAAPVTGTEGSHRELRAVMRRLSAAKNAGGIEDAEAQAQVLGHAVDACIGQIREFLATAPQSAGAERVDLVSYLERQWAWSKETFGPARRTKGIVQHITKELREIEAEPHDLAEWVDVIILAMDGFWRHGGKPEDLLPAMQAKQDRNFARTWPDWRTMGEDQAIEHDRSGEAPASLPAALGSGEGTAGATEAVKFAIGIDDHYDRLEFLQDWLAGDTSEWPEFATLTASQEQDGEVRR